MVAALLSFGLAAVLHAETYVVPVVTARLKDVTYSTTTGFRNDAASDVECTARYVRENGHVLTGVYTVKAGATLVEPDTLLEAAPVGSMRLSCSGPLTIASRIQASKDDGLTFDTGRLFAAGALRSAVTPAKSRSMQAGADLLVLEPDGERATFAVIVRSRDGAVAAQRVYNLPAYAQQQIDMATIRESLPEARIEIQVASGRVVVLKQTRDAAVGRIAPEVTMEQRVLAARSVSATAVEEVKPSITELLLICPFKAAPFREPATGLCFMRDRWYDPSTGTFLTPDPMGYADSSNLYAFCAGDPVNCSDPTGRAASMSKGGWIAATNNRNGGRIRRFSPAEIAGNPMAVRAFLGRNADVDPRAADAMIEGAGQAWATGGDRMRVVAPGAAKAAGVYPLMAITAGAGIGGGIGTVAAGAGGFGFAGTTMLSGFTGGIGSQTGADLYDRRFSGVEQYLTAGSVSAATSLVIGGVFAGGRRLIGGPGGTPSITGALPDDWYIPDSAYVRFDATKFDDPIGDFGIQARFFRDGRVWLARYGDIRHIENAADLETLLYRKNLWSQMEGRFDTGATLRIVRNADDVAPAGVTNRVNGIPQWRVVRDIPPSDLTVVKRLPYGR